MCSVTNPQTNSISEDNDLIINDDDDDDDNQQASRKRRGPLRPWEERYEQLKRLYQKREQELQQLSRRVRYSANAGLDDDDDDSLDEAHDDDDDDDDPSLQSWIASVRSAYHAYQRGQITSSYYINETKIELLNAIGFIWNQRQQDWEDQLGLWKALSLSPITDESTISQPNTATSVRKNTRSQIASFMSSNKSLKHWCWKQRRLYREGTLESWKIQRLQDAGFCLDTKEQEWQDWFQQLVEYSNQETSSSSSSSSSSGGGVEVYATDGYAKLMEELSSRHHHNDSPKVFGPTAGKRGGNLGSWCAKQRKDYREDKLTSLHYEQLQGIGFVWDVAEERFQQGLSKLRAFRQEHGHIHVPTTHPELGPWFYARRNEYLQWVTQQQLWVRQQEDRPVSTSRLSEEHRLALEEVGFSPQLFSEPRHLQRQRSRRHYRRWEEWFQELVAYQQKHGHVNVPSREPLGKWVSKQRSALREFATRREPTLSSMLSSSSSLSRLLLSDGDDRSSSTLLSLSPTIMERPATNVDGSIDEYTAGGAALEVAKDPTKEQLKRIDLLNDIGFVWDYQQYVWDQRYEELVQLKATSQHLMLPAVIDNVALHQWCDKQRREYALLLRTTEDEDDKNGDQEAEEDIDVSTATRKAQITWERAQRLDELGFDWNPGEKKSFSRDLIWWSNYKLLQELYQNMTRTIEVGNTFNQTNPKKKVGVDDSMEDKNHWNAHQGEVAPDLIATSTIAWPPARSHPQVGEWTYQQRRSYKRWLMHQKDQAATANEKEGGSTSDAVMPAYRRKRLAALHVFEGITRADDRFKRKDADKE